VPNKYHGEFNCQQCGGNEQEYRERSLLHECEAALLVCSAELINQAIRLTINIARPKRLFQLGRLSLSTKDRRC